MTILSLDIETYSDVDLLKSGVYRYVDSPQFEVLLVAYAIDDEPVTVVDLACGEELPAPIREMLGDEGVIKTAFNANFERVCLSKWFQESYSASSWQCTAVQAASLALPQTLALVGRTLNLPHQKLEEGKSLIRKFCVPTKPSRQNGFISRYLPHHDPESWGLFKDYCKRDVEVERDIRLKLARFPLSFLEQSYYTLDQRINDRGISVDRELVTQAIACDRLYKEQVTKRAYELSGLENPNSVAQLKDWFKGHNLFLDSLSKKTIQAQMKEADGEVLEMLKLRLLLSKTSVKKYEAIERCVTEAGTVHGLLRFYGANRTGRWCLTGDHEVLTQVGWVSLENWQGGRIACFYPATEAIAFQPAEKVVFDFEGDLYHYKDKRIDQLSTGEHKMLVKRQYGQPWQADTVENMIAYRPLIPFTGFRSLQTCLESAHLRVLIMTQADGHFTQDGVLRFHFKKLRKIERCKQLLRRADITFTSTINGDGTTTLSISSRHQPLWLRQFKDKVFGSWLLDESPDVVIDELVHWDGYYSAKNSIQYTTTVKQNADLIQALAHLSGRAALIRERHREKNWKTAYIVNIWLTPKNEHQIRSKPTRQFFKGLVYCPVTPSGYFLVRRQGTVWVTGNSGQLVQVQNLPQNKLADLDLARSLVKAGQFETLDLLYDNVPNVLSELIRTAFIPRLNHQFVVADYAAIEARVLAWLSGEDWRLQVFEEGGDIYCASASAMFGIPVEKHGLNSHLRQKGKIAELALGYGGSVGALTAMGALDMGMEEDELQPLVTQWRQANPHIVAFWWAIDQAAKEVLKTKQTQHLYGLTLSYEAGIFFITLPSGRRLSYVKPRLELNAFGKLGMTYEGIGDNKKWTRIDTYGPKLVENIVQAIARDLLAHGMLVLDQAGFSIVLHVHDEAVVEVPIEAVDVQKVCDLLATKPQWADGLPLRADGYACDFYQKD
ncbi:DNA polymerase [Streptococcus suis]